MAPVAIPILASFPLISVISGKSLVFVLVLFRHVVLRKLRCPHFALVGVARVLHAAYRFSLGILAFFQQFFHALGVVILSARKSLRIAGLAA